MPVFEAGMLPDSQKEDLCRSLLDEFGAQQINRRDDELIHGCLLPHGNHKDQARNPTASLNWKKLTYKCLGCGSGGGLLWFIATCRRTSSTDARKWLEGATGTGNTLMGMGELLAYFDALYTKTDRYEPIPTYSERVLAPWEWRHPYMEEIRSVPEATQDRFRIGWDPEFDRIVIPHFWDGRLVGWQTRRLADDGSPKYLSSPEFPRDQTIYNYDYMAQEVVLVESPLSVLRHEHHSHLEATFGASITERQIRLLQKHPKVVLWMDNDKAGWDALEDHVVKRKIERQGLITALKGHSKVYVVNNPWAADPADLPDDEYDRLVSEAVPWPLWTRPDPESLRVWEEVNA